MKTSRIAQLVEWSSPSSEIEWPFKVFHDLQRWYGVEFSGSYSCGALATTEWISRNREQLPSFSYVLIVSDSIESINTAVQSLEHPRVYAFHVSSNSDNISPFKFSVEEERYSFFSVTHEYLASWLLLIGHMELTGNSSARNALKHLCEMAPNARGINSRTLIYNNVTKEIHSGFLDTEYSAISEQIAEPKAEIVGISRNISKSEIDTNGIGELLANQATRYGTKVTGINIFDDTVCSHQEVSVFVLLK